MCGSEQSYRKINAFALQPFEFQLGTQGNLVSMDRQDDETINSDNNFGCQPSNCKDSDQSADVKYPDFRPQSEVSPCPNRKIIAIPNACSCFEVMKPPESPGYVCWSAKTVPIHVTEKPFFGQKDGESQHILPHVQPLDQQQRYDTCDSTVEKTCKGAR